MSARDYLGVVWAYSKQPDDIKMKTNWDSFEWGNSEKGKAPTAISYGAPVSDTGVAENSSQNSRAVADYLRLLWNHALTNINKDFGQVAVDGTPFRVVLTVPAVWKTKAKDRMAKAVKRAGILDVRLAGETTLNFVSEPEAAALATFQDLKARPNFQTGDTFVDFEGLMSQLFGDAWNVPEGDKREIMGAQWANGIKRIFEDQDRAWRVTLPQCPMHATNAEHRHPCNLKSSPPSPLLWMGQKKFLTSLHREFVEDISDNVISQIRALVSDQISAVEKRSGHLPKAVVLVGGPGGCRYFFKKLNEENEPCVIFGCSNPQMISRNYK
ncbi:hypothetical protein DM02DRAFT_731204 [Periconia macrospinosa]|uniref:Actin-like ATPase domain-containing protein n=1 Tax=Periconia macrospinosa TaxID=97972 RepID=A0A2V1DE73_9PLEO|nr:hypothetical protein DM02DRAFT_731204 [Periconia macrospinosa]